MYLVLFCNRSLHFTAVGYMDRTNTYMMDFIEPNDTTSVVRTDAVLWWGLAVIEIVLAARLVLEYTNAATSNALTYVMYQVTDYLLLPFTIMLASVSGNGTQGWVTAVAIVGYCVIVIALIRLRRSLRSPRSRIEYARELSRKKYSR